MHPVAFRLDRQLRTAMIEYRAREGVSLANQMRRAIRAWLAWKDKIASMPRQ